MSKLGDVRRSQVITTHGPGSIIDFRAGSHGGAAVSVVGAGLEQWDVYAPPAGLGNPQTVFEPRLQKKLGVNGFRLPPVAAQISPGNYSSKSGRLAATRFPRWLQCPQCHILQDVKRWSEDPGDAAPYCGSCTSAAGGRNRVHAVPVRFIVMCDSGHLDEFPWKWWARHTEDCSKSRPLRLEGSATAGLAGLLLSCTECSAKRSMEGCFNPDAIPSRCSGKRPWLGFDTDEMDCQSTPRAVQRGASNIYYSATESALDIPPWSDDLQKKLGFKWSLLEKAMNDEVRRNYVVDMNLPEILNRDADEILALINDRILRLNTPDRNLRWEEYHQFIKHKKLFGENTEFEIHPSPAPPELKKWFSTVVRATRIREVRALYGFTRVNPPTSSSSPQIAKLSFHKQDWLPAIENRGEGIFLQLNPKTLSVWENQENVKNKIKVLSDQQQRAWKERKYKGNPKEITARFLLVHSLAHALIRQLALNCGYNTASLRERLYVGLGQWDMAGLLIFTSSPDADGTLGGLVKQGEDMNLVPIIEDCIASMTWCSSDPLCIEGVHSLSTPASGAACHSCLLAAETSCEEFNVYLDRSLMVGTPDDPGVGYFQELIQGLGE